jgi:phytoene dehydrogenase-like protein
MRTAYDLIVVGGGIGGTALGALQAHRGRSVLLLDKNKSIGGRCTSYEKDGFVVDLGVHLFGVGDRGSLGDVCRRVGRPEAIQWLSITNPVLRYKDELKRYSRRTMQEMVPESEMENLGALFMTLFSLGEEEIQGLWYLPLSQWVNRFSTNALVHAFIEMICGQYFCVRSGRASTAEFIRCFKEVVMARSSAYPQGGCISIPRAYAAVIGDHGGDVFLKTRVQRILVEDGSATGVELADGTRVRARAVVSNADVKETVSVLTGPDRFPPSYVDRVSRIEYAYHALGLKVALEQKITDDQLMMYLPCDYEEAFHLAQAVMETGELPERLGGMITSPTNYDPSLAPAGRQLIFFGTACPPRQDWARWETVLLDTFYHLYPQARGKVLWHRLDTPDLVEAYAGEDGNIIGAAQTVDQVHERRLPQITPVKNLYLCGAEAGGHGIGTELAARSALELDLLLAG